mgnify:CR=1 FL=1|tara:strand:- start:11123 stop:12265 length:1143 start_codon:yes stop_codon:yes gene_type:complete
MTSALILIEKFEYFSRTYTQRGLPDVIHDIDSDCFQYDDQHRDAHIYTKVYIRNFTATQALLYHLFHFSYLIINEMLYQGQPPYLINGILTFIGELQAVHCEVTRKIIHLRKDVWVVNHKRYEKTVPADLATNESQDDLNILWNHVLNNLAYDGHSDPTQINRLQQSHVIPSQFLFIMALPLGRYLLRKLLKLAIAKNLDFLFGINHRYGFKSKPRSTAQYHGDIAGPITKRIIPGEYTKPIIHIPYCNNYRHLKPTYMYYGVNTRGTLQYTIHQPWLVIIHELLHWRSEMKGKPKYVIPCNLQFAHYWTSPEEYWAIAGSHCGEQAFERLLGLPIRVSHRAESLYNINLIKSLRKANFNSHMLSHCHFDGFVQRGLRDD